jgi:hypothetical protein
VDLVTRDGLYVALGDAFDCPVANLGQNPKPESSLDFFA